MNIEAFDVVNEQKLENVFYPKDLFEVLEFDKVINLALPFCKGEPGRSLLQKSNLKLTIYKFNIH